MQLGLLNHDEKEGAQYEGVTTLEYLEHPTGFRKVVPQKFVGAHLEPNGVCIEKTISFLLKNS